VPVTVSEQELKGVRDNLGELPAALRTRLEQTYGITPYDSDVLVNQGLPLVNYYVRLAELCGDGKQASNWLQQDVLRTLNDQNQTIEQYPIQPEALADLLKRVAGGNLNTTRGREVLADMLATGRGAAEIMQERGIGKVDESELIALCQELIAANPKTVADVKAGKLQAAGAFVGQAKKRNPNVDPARIREICLELIAKG
jgi:aspartyl-tRNA(Asn)/glutamyl-tRNA(Gln) amidotransferase subunit B